MNSGTLRDYAIALAAVAACTLAGFAMRPRFDIVNVAMVYVLAVVIVALRCSRGASVACAAGAVLIFDLVFVPPRGRLTVEDVQYLFTFAIMLAVALSVSALSHRARRQLEEKSAAALAIEAERIRSTLLASISHDIRTPLAVIAGAASTLATASARLGDAERDALARTISERALATAELVNKVLQMTRLEHGAVVLEPDWASIAEIAGSVLARHADALSAHRVLVEIPDELPLVRVDAALIDQALSNLLDNAARHTPAGTLVRVRAERAGEELVVSVEDRGPGLPDAARERVFAKFHHGDAHSAGGVGLGLAICRAIVTLHRGRAWAEPVTGGGSVFRFSLPLEPQPPMPAAEDGA